MSLTDEKRCVAGASLRYQLQPGRFRFLEPHVRLLFGYMLEADEWRNPWEVPVVGAAVQKDGVLMLAFANNAIVSINGGRAWLDAAIEDVIRRAELDGSEDAEFLRSWPRVRDNRLRLGG